MAAIRTISLFLCATTISAFQLEDFNTGVIHNYTEGWVPTFQHDYSTDPFQHEPFQHDPFQHDFVEINDPARMVFLPKIEGACIKATAVKGFTTPKFDGLWVNTASAEYLPCSAVAVTHFSNGTLLQQYYEGSTNAKPTEKDTFQYTNAVATRTDRDVNITQTVLQTDYTSFALILRCAAEKSFTFNFMVLLTRNGNVTKDIQNTVRAQNYDLETGFLIGNLGLNIGEGCSKA